jgi:predicted ester cyclase
MDTIEINKAIVRRYVEEFIGKDDMAVFHEIIAEDYVNHTAPPNTSKGPDGVLYFFHNFLKPSFPKLEVTIHHLIGEGDLVTTYKSLHGIHEGTFMGIAPTGKKVVIDIMDIVTVRDGKITNHWHVADWSSVIAQLQ